MVSELVKESIKQSVGLQILFFLSNGFRFEGKVLGADDEYLKYYDSKKGCIRFVKLNDISEAELK